MPTTIIPRGSLLTIEIATLVAGGFQVTAVYAGGPLEEDVLEKVGDFATLELVAAALPSVELSADLPPLPRHRDLDD